MITKTRPKTPLRWLKDEDGNFSIEHAVQVLKGACLSVFKTGNEIAEVIEFICEHARTNCDAITERAQKEGFDVSEVLDLKGMNLVQAALQAWRWPRLGDRAGLLAIAPQSARSGASKSRARS